MGPRVKFATDPEVIDRMDKQLISNDLGGRERIQWMVFKLGNESWDFVAEGRPTKNWWTEMFSYCQPTEGAHLVFRSNDGNSDVWIKWIPDGAAVKERTLFSTASDSLFDDTRGTKHKFEIRDTADLNTQYPPIAQFFK
eukprot:Protomagalhaensia_wolfi_Nauph_80__2389@NODE_2572_length_1049_cov_1517_559406_g2012_i0_p2_GENE_NODE_2572_length_1049_cov_1517_559406_g2012_i0NODE_2572_length_1049_cov_1517_559406_g2012_i0_p2_ORF_typecomplete_len139_score30_80Cofilin_ADF/PF00241_20/1_3e09_NODE_2572_length_1049_cov_1517_559406_g2012_i067483